MLFHEFCRLLAGLIEEQLQSKLGRIYPYESATAMVLDKIGAKDQHGLRDQGVSEKFKRLSLQDLELVWTKQKPGHFVPPSRNGLNELIKSNNDLSILFQEKESTKESLSVFDPYLQIQLSIPESKRKTMTLLTWGQLLLAPDSLFEEHLNNTLKDSNRSDLDTTLETNKMIILLRFLFIFNWSCHWALKALKDRAALKAQKRQIEQSIGQLEKQNDEFSTLLEDAKKARENFNTQNAQALKDLETELDELKKKQGVEESKGSEDSSANIETIKQQVATKTEQLKKISDQIVQLQYKISELERQVQESTEEIARLKSSIPDTNFTYSIDRKLHEVIQKELDITKKQVAAALKNANEMAVKNRNEGTTEYALDRFENILHGCFDWCEANNKARVVGKDSDKVITMDFTHDLSAIDMLEESDDAKLMLRFFSLQAPVVFSQLKSAYQPSQEQNSVMSKFVSYVASYFSPDAWANHKVTRQKVEAYINYNAHMFDIYMKYPKGSLAYWQQIAKVHESQHRAHPRASEEKGWNVVKPLQKTTEVLGWTKSDNLFTLMHAAWVSEIGTSKFNSEEQNTELKKLKNQHESGCNC